MKFDPIVIWGWIVAASILVLGLGFIELAHFLDRREKRKRDE